MPGLVVRLFALRDACGLLYGIQGKAKQTMQFPLARRFRSTFMGVLSEAVHASPRVVVAFVL